VLDIGENFPRPTLEERAIAGAQLRVADRPATVTTACLWSHAGGGPLLRERYPLVALVHHPLALETGLGDAEAAAPARASA
jgi:hypothetical protein